MADLPPPEDDARAHCERLVHRVREEIEAAEGWISFRRYMDLALYAPGLGYYAAGAEKLGPAGDFTTAPEMTPLFGAALARQIAAILGGSKHRDILELGAGTGRLARSILVALGESGELPARYRILETSPDLRERQHALLAREAPQYLGRVRWLERLPARIHGAVIANEVLDAIPVHVLHRTRDAWLERGVAVIGERTPPHYGLGWADRPASPALIEVARTRFPAVEDYVSEINPAAEALVEDLGRRLATGAAIFVDYGFPSREFYHPQRSAGTLMCHYHHRSHGDPFFYPGLSDITSHVDFTAIAQAATRGGAQIAGYCPQAAFLLGCGILERLAAVGAPDTLEYMKAAAQVQHLVSPAEMGELFKVLAFTRSPDIPWPGFTLAGGRYRL